MPQTRKYARKPSQKKSRKMSKKTKKTIDKLRKKPNINKPWRKVTNMTRKTRAEMQPHCLLDPSHLKYPICYKGGQDISCVGLQAAKKRAQLQKNDSIKNKAKQLEKIYNCNEKGKWESREKTIFQRSVKNV